MDVAPSSVVNQQLPPVMHLTLTGRSNEQYFGTLFLANSNSSNHPRRLPHPAPSLDHPGASGASHPFRDYGGHQMPRSNAVMGHGGGGGGGLYGLGGSDKFYHQRRINDPTGATYYVVAVVLVYGFSIVLLIASHIKRKNAKCLEDRQINKYLQEFQVRTTEKDNRITSHLTPLQLIFPEKSSWLPFCSLLLLGRR